jgi:formylglycine-generating enzyme required for sulfatase activity
MRSIFFTIIFTLSCTLGFSQSQIVHPQAAKPSKPAKPVSMQQTKNGKKFTVHKITFNMIKVEGGTFSMGATPEQKEPRDAEKPVHQVTLSTYYIGETEVTQALWQAVMGENPSYHPGNNLPVEQVSWYDCQRFIKKLNDLTGQNFRLPTEAEWEFAARGGNKSCGYQYSGSNNLEEVTLYRTFDRYNVKSYTPNELGIYDMSGSVAEWCYDWFSSNYYTTDSVTNPTGPVMDSTRLGLYEYRVQRGGPYDTMNASQCSVSHRSLGKPGERIHDLGLRLAL